MFTLFGDSMSTKEERESENFNHKKLSSPKMKTQMGRNALCVAQNKS